MAIEVSREKFKSTVAAGLARANNEMHDVLGSGYGGRIRIAFLLMFPI